MALSSLLLTVTLLLLCPAPQLAKHCRLASREVWRHEGGSFERSPDRSRTPPFPQSHVRWGVNGYILRCRLLPYRLLLIFIVRYGDLPPPPPLPRLRRNRAGWVQVVALIGISKSLGATCSLDVWWCKHKCVKTNSERATLCAAVYAYMMWEKACHFFCFSSVRGVGR